MNKFTANIALVLIVVTGLLFFQGCADNPYGAVKVTGTVTLDGEPAEGVTIAFYPVNAEIRESFGRTDAQGQFVLTIPGAPIGSGAMPGEYIVGLIKQKCSTEDMTEAARERFINAGGLPYPIDLLPSKYSDRNATDIPPVKVERGKKNEFAFDLFSK